MDSLLSRFLTKIGLTDLTPYEGASFAKVDNDKDNNRITAIMALDHYLDYPVYETLFDTISGFVSHGGFGIRLSFTYKNEANYFPRILEEFKDAKDCTLMNDVQFFEDEKKVLFLYPSAPDAAEMTNETRLLKDFLDSISSSYSVLQQERVYTDNSFSKNREEEYQQTAQQAAISYEEAARKANTYQPSKLKDIENFSKVVVEGKIFKIEDKVIRKNNHLMRNIEYSDGSDSISTTLFEGKEMTIDQVKSFDVGVKIRVQGRPDHDKFARNALVLKADKIEILPPDPLREDTYPRKRVELHLHTKMSAFDGLATIGDYADTAKRWGHKAIAVTDHGVVQAFPDAQKAQIKTGLKILYGTELYLVDDKVTFIYNPSDKVLAQETYVVFDTETTGLSCRYDRLIEFGAVKMDPAGQIIDTIDFFINPDMKLSGFSTEISHIRQEDVDHGKPIKQALRDIKAFFGNSILVAHNASFDYGFINEALRNNQMDPIANPVIDTLPLSRFLYPDMRSHREEALARRLMVDFDATGAHRANYDAGHLANIFSAMLSELAKQVPACKCHKDLAALPVKKEMLLTAHPYHVTAYVKNMAGLKDLYRIISESSTEYIASDGTPLCPRSYLDQYRSNLLIGSACLNGEVWEAAMTKSKETLKTKIASYDFIEVQPPENYIYQIHTGELHSMDEVKMIIKDLITTAKEMGKTVCATGDCHYLNPEDKIYRDVFISSKGLKGARHPLNLAPYDSASEEVKKAWYAHPLPNPDQHFRTTDEMMACFDFLGDKALEEEIVIDNTNKIADAIGDDIKPTKDKLYPPKIEGCEKMLTDLVDKTAKEMYGDPLPKEITDRLQTELKGIIDNGYSVIYWLSSMIVRWSNQEGFLIGSRGSVGSSLVATMSGITEVNPLPPHYRCPKCHYLEWADPKVYGSGFDLPAKKCPKCGHDLIGDGQNIPFATFLGFHAEKVPDIDLNFPSDFQSIAHEHMKQELNKTGNICFKAGTIQTTQEKQARGYVLGYYESLGMDTAKIRPSEMDRLGMGCVDVKRSTGQHPGGVIVIPAGMEVYDFTPVQYPADDPDSSWMTTHYDFHAIHDNVLKFDMLGHVDPQAVKMQCDLCGIPFTQLQEAIPISDPKALSLFWSADALHLKKNVLEQETGALGLPEFGTENGRRILHETKPHSFADLVRISGLSHGTNVYAGNARDLILDQNMTLRDVIACRDDIMTGLHENYGLDLSDTFKIMEIVRKGNFCKPGFEEKREKYTQLMKDHGVPDYYLQSCEKIQYLFPRGHAVAYVMMAVRCAWFKVYHPLEYYATYFTLRCDAYDIETMLKGGDACYRKLVDIKNRLANREQVETKEESLINTYEQVVEMYDRGYKFSNLSVNKSLSMSFSVDKETQTIVPPFKVIGGVASAVGDQIVAARKDRPFTSVEDLEDRGHVSEKLVKVFRDMDALDGLPDSDQLTLF